eukprot:tig00000492_g1433.t1
MYTYVTESYHLAGAAAATHQRSVAPPLGGVLPAASLAGRGAWDSPFFPVEEHLSVEVAVAPPTAGDVMPTSLFTVTVGALASGQILCVSRVLVTRVPRATADTVGTIPVSFSGHELEIAWSAMAVDSSCSNGGGLMGASACRLGDGGGYGTIALSHQAESAAAAGPERLPPCARFGGPMHVVSAHDASYKLIDITAASGACPVYATGLLGLGMQPRVNHDVFLKMVDGESSHTGILGTCLVPSAAGLAPAAICTDWPKCTRASVVRRRETNAAAEAATLAAIVSPSDPRTRRAALTGLSVQPGSQTAVAVLGRGGACVAYGSRFGAVLLSPANSWTSLRDCPGRAPPTVAPLTRDSWLIAAPLDSGGLSVIVMGMSQ